MVGSGAEQSQWRPEQVAGYVADLAKQLKILVERHEMRELAYLLDLVRAEAEEKARTEAKEKARAETDRVG